METRECNKFMVIGFELWMVFCVHSVECIFCYICVWEAIEIKTGKMDSASTKTLLQCSSFYVQFCRLVVWQGVVMKYLFLKNYEF